MNDLQPETITVPSELERGDGFVDLAALFASGLGVWYGVLHGVPLLLMAPVVVLIAVWTLTGEPAGDVPYLGAIAAGLRSKLGLRRAHEWALAYGHYVRLVEWPKGQERWQRSRLRSAMRTSIPWLRLPSGSGARLLSKRLRFWSKS